MSEHTSRSGDFSAQTQKGTNTRENSYGQGFHRFAPGSEGEALMRAPGTFLITTKKKEGPRESLSTTTRFSNLGTSKPGGEIGVKRVDEITKKNARLYEVLEGAGIETDETGHIIVDPNGVFAEEYEESIRAELAQERAQEEETLQLRAATERFQTLQKRSTPLYKQRPRDNRELAALDQLFQQGEELIEKKDTASLVKLLGDIERTIEIEEEMLFEERKVLLLLLESAETFHELQKTFTIQLHTEDFQNRVKEIQQEFSVVKQIPTESVLNGLNNMIEALRQDLQNVEIPQTQEEKPIPVPKVEEQKPVVQQEQTPHVVSDEEKNLRLLQEGVTVTDDTYTFAFIDIPNNLIIHTETGAWVKLKPRDIETVAAAKKAIDRYRDEGEKIPELLAAKNDIISALNAYNFQEAFVRTQRFNRAVITGLPWSPSIVPINIPPNTKKGTPGSQLWEKHTFNGSKIKLETKTWDDISKRFKTIDKFCKDFLRGDSRYEGKKTAKEQKEIIALKNELVHKLDYYDGVQEERLTPILGLLTELERKINPQKPTQETTIEPQPEASIPQEETTAHEAVTNPTQEVVAPEPQNFETTREQIVFNEHFEKCQDRLDALVELYTNLTTEPILTELERETFGNEISKLMRMHEDIAQKVKDGDLSPSLVEYEITLSRLERDFKNLTEKIEHSGRQVPEKDASEGNPLAQVERPDGSTLRTSELAVLQEKEGERSARIDHDLKALARQRYEPMLNKDPRKFVELYIQKEWPTGYSAEQKVIQEILENYHVTLLERRKKLFEITRGPEEEKELTEIMNLLALYPEEIVTKQGSPLRKTSQPLKRTLKTANNFRQVATGFISPVAIPTADPKNPVMVLATENPANQLGKGLSVDLDENEAKVTGIEAVKKLPHTESKEKIWNKVSKLLATRTEWVTKTFGKGNWVPFALPVTTRQKIEPKEVPATEKQQESRSKTLGDVARERTPEEEQFATDLNQLNFFNLVKKYAPSLNLGSGTTSRESELPMMRCDELLTKPGIFGLTQDQQRQLCELIKKLQQANEQTGIPLSLNDKENVKTIVGLYDLTRKNLEKNIQHYGL